LILEEYSSGCGCDQNPELQQGKWTIKESTRLSLPDGPSIKTSRRSSTRMSSFVFVRIQILRIVEKSVHVVLNSRERWNKRNPMKTSIFCINKESIGLLIPENEPLYLLGSKS